MSATSGVSASADFGDSAGGTMTVSFRVAYVSSVGTGLGFASLSIASLYILQRLSNASSVSPAFIQRFLKASRSSPLRCIRSSLSAALFSMIVSSITSPPASSPSYQACRCATASRRCVMDISSLCPSLISSASTAIRLASALRAASNCALSNLMRSPMMDFGTATVL